jgi:hypothetical protein
LIQGERINVKSNECGLRIVPHERCDDGGDQASSPGGIGCQAETAREGSLIRIEDEDGIADLALVGPQDADAVNGRVSVESPLGHALLGRRVGDRVRFRAPGGVLEVTVVGVS